MRVAEHDREGSRAVVPGELERQLRRSGRDAARLLYTGSPMSEEEREQFGLTEAERRSLIRLDSAKVNICAPSTEARWFRIVGVPLGNSSATYPHGDVVPTVEPWTPPDLWRDISTATANEILDEIGRGAGEGRQYSGAKQADERAAWRVVAAKLPELSEDQCQIVIATWLKTGVIEKTSYQDPVLRKQRSGLAVVRRPG